MPYGGRAARLALAALALLAGCSGERTTLQSLTGAEPPAETWEQQLARVPDILSRGDHFNVSSLHLETADGEAIVVPLSCSGRSCVDELPEFEDRDRATPLSTRNGVTAVMVTRQDTFTAWSSWLEHSGFTVESYTGTDPFTGTGSQALIGAGGGEKTGSAPAGSATWRGVMTGTPATGPRRGKGLTGDAKLTFDMNDLTLDAAFTGIVDIDRLALHSVSSVRFSGVPVSRDGTYAQRGETGDLISGGFYGPGHAETAGAFEKSSIVGAFGAKSQ